MSIIRRVTVQDAPRNKEELAQLGRYQLRSLAYQIGALTTFDACNAFMAMSVEEQAQVVLEELVKIDGPVPGLIEALLAYKKMHGKRNTTRLRSAKDKAFQQVMRHIDAVADALMKAREGQWKKDAQLAELSTRLETTTRRLNLLTAKSRAASKNAKKRKA